MLFGVRIRDINFAFKLCRRRVLDEITLVSEGSFIDAELVIRTIGSGGKVVQFGVDYFPRTRGVSTLVVAGRHREDPAGDVHAPTRAAGHRARPREGRRFSAQSG